MIFAFGLLSVMAWQLLRTHALARRHLEFLVAAAAVAGVLIVASVAAYGFTTWKEFLTNITLHDRTISSTRVGFKYLFLLPYATSAERLRGFASHQFLWWAIQAAVLVGTFLAVRALEDYEAIVLGFVPTFFLTAPTFYYYAMLVVPFLLFAPKTGQADRACGSPH